MSDTSTIDSVGLAAALNVIEGLPGFDVPADLQSLPGQLAAARPGVAFVGLLSRGKSTVFNALVGAEVSPVDVLAETCTVVEAATGRQEARGYQGRATEQLPCDPASFAASISRAGGQEWQQARIHGPFRLPAGLRLVDTPGLSEAGKIDVASWRKANVGAVVLMIGVPPGLASQDRELFEAVAAEFPGRVVVALTPLSAHVPDGTLDRWAEIAEQHLGQAPVRIPATPPTAPWGRDPRWAPVEEAVLALVRGADEARRDGAQRLETFVASTAGRISTRHWSDDDDLVLQAAIEALAATGGSDAGAPVRHALESARAGILQSRRQAQQEEAEAKRRRRQAEEDRQRLRRDAEYAVERARLAVSEAKNWQPLTLGQKVGSFLGSDAGTRPLWAKARTAWREVAKLARNGAEPAVTAWESMAKDSNLRKKLGLSRVEVVMALPDDARRSATYSRMSWSGEQRWELINKLPAASELRKKVEADLTRSFPADPGFARRVATTTQNRELTVRAHGVAQGEVLASLANLHGPAVEDLAAWSSQRDAAIAAAHHWIDRAKELGCSEADIAETRDRIGHALGPGTSDAEASARLVNEAKARQEEQLNNWRTAHGASYLLWLVAFMTAAGNFGAGLVVWLASLALWIKARSEIEQLSLPDGWHARYTRMTQSPPSPPGAKNGGWR